MHRGGFLQCVQMPSLLAHHITDFQNVDSRALPRPESDNRDGRVTENIEFRDLGLDSMDYLSSGNDDILR